MGRKKHNREEELLSRPILFRVTAQEYDRLESIQQQSDCHSIGEVIRRILRGKRITFFHRDSSLDGPLEELARIRQELKAIGGNINQITRHFNGSSQEARRMVLAPQALAQYQKVEVKISLLLSLISQLAKKW